MFICEIALLEYEKESFYSEAKHNGGIMFYTDTNGQFPFCYSKALVILGIAMDSMPLDEIDFEVFKAIDPEIDSEKLDLLKC